MTARAQEMPPSPVRYTEVREHAVQRTIHLPGTVESRYASMVASEVYGRVDDLPAREGTPVQRGQVLVRLNTAERELERRAAAARLREAEARLELAQRNLDRARDLFDEKVVPQQDLDNAISEFHAWEGRVEQNSADLDRIELDLARSTIRAPFSGIVVAERREVGEWVAVGDAVVEVLSLEELEVRVDVPERYFQNLSPDAEALVTFEALDGFQVTGRVRAIIPRAREGARTFPLLVRISNRDGRIGVGMLADVSILAGNSYRAVVVPKDAVITNGDERFVYLIGGDNTVAMTPVTAGAGVGSWIVVEGAVEPGQKVVTRGNERLFPGQQVQGEPEEYALP